VYIKHVPGLRKLEKKYSDFSSISTSTSSSSSKIVTVAARCYSCCLIHTCACGKQDTFDEIIPAITDHPDAQLWKNQPAQVCFALWGNEFGL
jgi:hypothetical protein